LFTHSVLSGGLYRDGVVLTDPVIQSLDKRYGPGDLGHRGISTFFARHRCNKYCRREWIRPNQPVAYFAEVRRKVG
jgi:hypothetical protein